MRRFWKQRREDEIERLLRANRAEPRDEFVSSLLGRIGTSRHRTSTPRLARRVLVAAAVTVLVAGASVAAGATHVAGTSISNLVNVAQSGFNGQTVNKSDKDSEHESGNKDHNGDADDTGDEDSGDEQYTVPVCHHTGSKKHPWHEIFVSPQGAANLVKHHPPDFIVDSTHPCPP